jgi:hypothetical protein
MIGALPLAALNALSLLQLDYAAEKPA